MASDDVMNMLYAALDACDISIAFIDSTASFNTSIWIQNQINSHMHTNTTKKYLSPRNFIRKVIHESVAPAFGLVGDV